MATKTVRPGTFLSGYCNPSSTAHASCALVAVGAGTGGTDLTCSCSCHVRYAAFWFDWDEAPQMQAGWLSEEDALLFLQALKAHEYIPADAVTDVDSYVGEVPW